MSGPLTGGSRVSWASRTDSSHSTRRTSGQSQGGSPSASRSTFFSPSEHRLTDQSPLPVSPDPQSTHRVPIPSADAAAYGPSSAPAELHQPHRKLTKPTPTVLGQTSFDLATLLPPSDTAFELDKMAPVRAAMERSGPNSPSRGSSGGASASAVKDEDGVKRWDHGLSGEMSLEVVEEVDEKLQEEEREGDREEEEDPGAQSLEGKGKSKEQDGRERPIDGAAGEGVDGGREEGPNWGESFRIEWIRTDRLPFHRTRHLRNPWNHDREVKVSRDGTELEPLVGQALLDEWDKEPEPPAQPSTDPAQSPAPRSPGPGPPSSQAGKGRGK